MIEHLEVPHLLRFLLAIAVTLLIRIIFITQAHTLGAFIPKGWKITPQLIDALCQPSNPLIINAMRSMEKRYCDHELPPGNPLI